MQTLTHRLLSRVVAGVLCGLARLPLVCAYWLGERLGDVAYYAMTERRRIALKNITRAFGADTPPRERRMLARATFRTLGNHIVDFSRLRALTPENFASICTVEGLDRVAKLLERRTGLLVLSAHFGSWELAPAVALCLATPLHVIVRPLDNPVLDHLIATYRQCCGYRMIPKRHALPESLAALRRGEMVAILMDQSSLRRHGVPIEFFGIKTYTSKGPALLALRAQCPVVGAFLIREAQGRHRLVFSQEIPICRTGNLPRDIVDNTRAFNHLIESYVRRYPDHWFWLHRRWKRRLSHQEIEGTVSWS